MKCRILTLSLTASLLASAALAWDPTPGKPFDGTEIKVLAVRAPQFDAHVARLPEFEEKTGIKVSYDFVPFANVREALAAEMVSGAGNYDVVSVMDQWVPSMSLLLAPMNVEKYGIDLSDYPQAHLAQGYIDGELNGLPLRGHVQVLFYRKDILNKLGLAVPDTWEKLVEVSEAVHAAEGIAGVALPYGKLNGQNLMIWYNMLWQKGGQLFDADGAPAFNSEAGVASMTDYIGFLRDKKIVREGAASFVEQDTINSFKQGHSALLPVWWWAYPQMIDEKQSTLKPEQIGIASMPTYAGAGSTTYTNTWIFGPTEGSAHPDAAMEFLAWLTDPAVERSVLTDPKVSDVVAVHFSNLENAEVNARWGGMHAAAAVSLRSAKPITYTENWPQIVEILETAVSELASGVKTDVKAVLDDAAVRVRELR